MEEGHDPLTQTVKWQNIITLLSDRRRGIGLSTGFITSIQWYTQVQYN
jgi:hypothetical protein